MIALRGLLVLLVSTTALGQSFRTEVAPAAVAALTSAPEPTGGMEAPERPDVPPQQEAEKQSSIAFAQATVARWHWLEMIRRQESQNETETETQTRTQTQTSDLPPTTPPTTRTHTQTSISSTSPSTSPTEPTSPTPPTEPTRTRSSTSSTSSSDNSSPDTSSDSPNPQSSSSSENDNPSTPQPTKPTSTTVTRTSTLPNGGKSTFTSVRVITPTADEASQPSNTEGAPSLQAGAADSIYGRLGGREAVALVGGAVGVAYLL